MWYAIRTTEHREAEVAGAIKRLVPDGLYSDIWIPMKEMAIRRRGIYEVDTVVLFLGFVFIKTEEPWKIHKYICFADNYIGFVKTGSEFMAIDGYDRDMFDKLRNMPGVLNMSRAVIRNGMAHVESGPLMGMDEKIVRVDRHRRKAWVVFNSPLCHDGRLALGLEITDSEAGVSF